jgi:hypothetical protein
MATAMVHQPVCHTWRLSEAGDENLGLAFTDDNLLIGRTPLIEKCGGQFVVRQQQDIERLLSRAYRTEIRADRLMPGLATVAHALNANDQCLARIAAVHLRVPDIPDRTARDAMEAMDAFFKYERDDGGGDSNWNPALHPRTGTPPNPGWFATTAGTDESLSGRVAENDDPTRRSDASSGPGDDWIHLRPGPQRLEELVDLIEWILNAKAADVPAITAEIDWYFGVWPAAAQDLKNMLAVLTKPGFTREDRQKYLNRLDLYTRVDPEEYVQVFGYASALAFIGGSIPPVARATEEAAETAAAESGVAQSAERNSTPYPRRGGRLGNPATRAQNAEIAADLQKQGFIITGGGGEAAEEYIRGAGPGTRGSVFVDITAINKETGKVTRVQTIDTLANGNPTPREAAAADKIRAAYPNDTLILIPKRGAR